MNITSRMLGIATIILWLVIVFFSVTAVYSVLNLVVDMGEAQMLPSGNGINLSFPFSIINGGYYELADLNLTTSVTDTNGIVMDLTETIVPSIPKDATVNSSHTIEIALDDILALDTENLLLNDSDFNVEIFVGLNFARAVPVQLSLNTTIPWGAPFANFSVGILDISVQNNTQIEVTIPVSFENHAVLDISGTLKLEVYNVSQNLIATGVTTINVPSGYSFTDNISLDISQEDVVGLSGTGDLHLVFETPMFTVDWWESYG